MKCVRIPPEEDDRSGLASTFGIDNPEAGKHKPGKSGKLKGRLQKPRHFRK